VLTSSVAATAADEVILQHIKYPHCLHTYFSVGAVHCLPINWSILGVLDHHVCCPSPLQVTNNLTNSVKLGINIMPKSVMPKPFSNFLHTFSNNGGHANLWGGNKTNAT